MSEQPHPRERLKLYGHESAERMVLARINAGNLPHALLITGKEGIGKASFAYRIARYMLAGPKKDAGQGGLFGEAPVAYSLDVAPDHPVAVRIASGGHADLVAIEPVYDEKKGEYKNEIQIEAVRRMSAFLSMTASEGGWRVIVIDSIDQLNRNAANAVLKILEEPPEKTLLLLVSHRPSSLLPTIRSRCQRVSLTAPDIKDFSHILEEQAGEQSRETIDMLYSLSQASPGLALRLLEEKALGFYNDLLAVITGGATPEQVAALAERAGSKSAMRMSTLLLLVDHAFGLVIKQAGGASNLFATGGEQAAVERAATSRPLEDWLALWEKSRGYLADTDRMYLDAKQSVSQMLHAL